MQNDPFGRPDGHGRSPRLGRHDRHDGLGGALVPEGGGVQAGYRHPISETPQHKRLNPFFRRVSGKGSRPKAEKDADENLDKIRRQMGIGAI